MDISLPVSDSSTAGAFPGASSRSVDNGRFSATLSKEMSGQADQEPVHGKTGSVAAHQADRRAHADAASRESPEENSAESVEHSSAGVAPESGKNAKKASEEAADGLPVVPDGNQTQLITAEEKSIRDSLKLLTGNSEDAAAETSEKSVTPAALDKAAGTAGNSVLANGSTNPALLRSNAVQNEIFSSLRTRHAATQSTDAGEADGLSTGKPAQQSGKNLPVSSKGIGADKPLNTLLPAGAQDAKLSADVMAAALQDKSAKFEALTLQFDSQSAESFSLVSAGSGKSALSLQPGLRSELTSPAAPNTFLASEFLAGSEEWCQDFGTKIEWLNTENVTRAELSLHPAELGVLDITINTEDDRISVNIVAHNEKSREMLESSLPRLTELLKSQGLALENSSVSHNSASDKHNTPAQQQGSGFGLSAEEHATESGPVRSAQIRHQGQIDHYV